MLGCRHKYCCASAFEVGHIGEVMNHPQPFSSSKECDLRRSVLLQGGGRSSQRALDRTAVTSTVRHSAAMTPSSDTPFAGSAYDRLDYDSLDEDTIEIVLSPEDMQSLSQAADEALAEAKATRAMAASLIASLSPAETRARTQSSTRAVAPPTVIPTVKAAPAAIQAAATAAPAAIKLSTAAAATAAVKPTVGTTTTVIQPPAAKRPTAAPAKAKTRRAAAESHAPNVSATMIRQALRRLPLHALGIVGIAAVTAVAIASIAHHNAHHDAPVLAQVSTVPAAPEPEAAAPETEAAPDPATAATAAQPQPVRVKNPFDHSEVFEFPAGTSLKEARQSMAQTLMQRAHDRGVPTFHPARAERHVVAHAKPSQSVGLAQNSVSSSR